MKTYSTRPCPVNPGRQGPIRLNRYPIALHLDLFPLNTVLLPGCVLPLHIFEPRYLRLTQECLEQERRFGIVFITSGSEVADPEAEFCDVGTSCEIVACQENANRTRDIRVLGRQRFKVLRVLETAPLVKAEVETLPWGRASLRGFADAERLRAEFTRYWDLLMRLKSFYGSAPPLGEDPLRTALTVAANLQVSAGQRQLLLDAPGIDDLLEACVDMLGSCTRALQNQLNNRQEQNNN